MTTTEGPKNNSNATNSKAASSSAAAAITTPASKREDEDKQTSSSSSSSSCSKPNTNNTITTDDKNNNNNNNNNNKAAQQRPEFHYEFGGPIGAAITTVALPLVVLMLAHFASAGKVDATIFRDLASLAFSTFSSAVDSSEQQQLQQRRDDDDDTNFSFSFSSSSSFSSKWDKFVSTLICPSCQTHNDIDTTGGDDCNRTEILLRCAGGIAAWFLFQVLLERMLPCELVRGTVLRSDDERWNGRRLLYRINGHLAFWITLLVVRVGYPVFLRDDDDDDSGSSSSSSRGGGINVQFRRYPLELLYDYYAELAVVTIILSFFLSLHLYVKSFDRGALLARGGTSGNFFYDFFMGRELNPRFGGGTFDWKEFCELRPGLIGWVVLNLAMSIKQHRVLGHVTGSMVLINIFQGWYVWDGLYQERAILTTMDITSDGFGFMLVFGDLVWVPFTYSLQARYLVRHDPRLGGRALAMAALCHVAGYAIFRGANGQKDAFRRDPNSKGVSHLTFLRTKRGTKLLTSGYWGMARKINYTGDWLMGLSWCLLCGFDSIVPYYYAIYFAVLLVHRSIRDDRMCHEKYGEDWIEYKKLVPYRFIPGII